jgi:Periplasmic copper-binding protein (NosD)
MEPNSISHYAATVVMLLTIMCAAAVLPTVVLPATTTYAQEAENGEEAKNGEEAENGEEAKNGEEAENGEEADFVKPLENGEGSSMTQETGQSPSNEAVVDDENEDEQNVIDLQMSHGNTPACGVVVKEDVTLNADLSCNGDGLIAGNNGITIDLNGHTIKSNGDQSVNFGDDNGILVPKAMDVKIIGPGLITGFDRAITYTGSSGGQVSDLILRDNEVGVLASGSRFIGINANTIDNNRYAVVLESSEKGQVAFNMIAANEKQGIVLLDSDEYKILTNSIYGNGKNGIFLDAQSFDNSVDFNSVFVHEKADINNANGVPPNINQNNFGENNNCNVSLPDGLC